jgi:hypothetical protein
VKPIILAGTLALARFWAPGSNLLLVEGGLLSRRDEAVAEIVAAWTIGKLRAKPARRTSGSPA